MQDHVRLRHVAAASAIGSSLLTQHLRMHVLPPDYFRTTSSVTKISSAPGGQKYSLRRATSGRRFQRQARFESHGRRLRLRHLNTSSAAWRPERPAAKSIPKRIATSRCDRVLLDRQLSRHEEDEIISAAEMMGLSREDAIEIHRIYLSALGSVALKDGIVTPTERAELVLVAGMLGLSADDADASLDPAAQVAIHSCTVDSFTLKAGDVVVFTGEAPGINRGDVEGQAARSVCA